MRRLNDIQITGEEWSDLISLSPESCKLVPRKTEQLPEVQNTQTGSTLEGGLLPEENDESSTKGHGKRGCCFVI